MKRPLIPEREKLQTLSAVQGSLLLILRNSKFEVLAAYLAKINFQKEEMMETHTHTQKYHIENTSLYYLLPWYFMTEWAVPRSQDESRHKGERGGQHDEKEGKSRAFQLPGCCFLPPTLLCAPRKEYRCRTPVWLHCAFPVGVGPSRDS